ncbi:non-hydrolyzing UDP-N-acetylglucosamine 2-epimerase [Yoonia algicola]|uniref:UDP-N-acetylglucosamine 2-epimerase (non-hydrolyzing) n=1 Tax=Yoonia algicola TaxID=3137368 RepID=A0AAN0NEG7_9RHOB
MKVFVAFGTRPEAIKCFPVIDALKAEPGVSVVACTTAQHRHILDQVLESVGLQPDIDLNLMREKPSLTDITVDVMNRMGEVLAAERPDRVIVQGDTTTAMATALAAFYQGIKVGHVEAGLRTNNILSPWPEEANRKIISTLADMHFAPTDLARDNLLRENVDPATVHVTGNTVIDALHAVRRRLKEKSYQVKTQEPRLKEYLDGDKRLILMTAHRRENWGEGIASICDAALSLVARGDTFIVFPVHPNPRVRDMVRDVLGDNPDIFLLEPLAYADFVLMLDRAAVVLTDSGGVQEEAPALGKPVLIMRDTTERPEGVSAGCAKLVGLDTAEIVAQTNKLLDDPVAYKSMSQVQNPYGDGTAAKQIVDIILGRKQHVVAGGNT